MAMAVVVGGGAQALVVVIGGEHTTPALVGEGVVVVAVTGQGVVVLCTGSGVTATQGGGLAEGVMHGLTMVVR